jgi:integrase
MNRQTTHQPFKITKHGNIRWRVTFAKGELDPTKGKKKDFQSEKEAKTFVKGWIKQRNNIGILSKQITPEQAADAVQASEILPAGVSILAAAKYTAQEIKKAEKSTTFKVAYENFLKWSEIDNRSVRHLRDHRQTMEYFNYLGDKNLITIKREEIENKIQTIPISSRNLKIRHLSAMFNYCIRQDWLEINPVFKIKQAKPKNRKTEVEIFSNQDVKTFMEKAKNDFKEVIPYFAIAFFAGTRPDEISKLKWVDLNDDEITITAFASKTGQQRYTTINPTLKAWINWYLSNGGKSEGKIFPKSTKTLERKRREIVKLTGIKWIQDGPRKTFASAHYKIHDEDKTLRELGHRGNQMLHKHYKRNIKQEEATEYWKILPNV